MSLLATFRNDPFFAGVDFPHDFPSDHRSIRDDFDRQLTSRHRDDFNRQLTTRHPDDFFEESSKFMESMMGNMRKMRKEMESRMMNMDMDMNIPENADGVSFSSSTMMSYDGRNPEQPRIFQATSEKIRGPEGLERSRKGIRDTSRNLEKMEVAHRIGNRAHRITKELDPNTGRHLENRTFEHIDNEREFEREWFDRAGRSGLRNLEGYGFDSSTNQLLPPASRALERSRAHSQQPSRLAIDEIPSNNRETRHRESKERSNL